MSLVELGYDMAKSKCKNHLKTFKFHYTIQPQEYKEEIAIILLYFKVFYFVILVKSYKLSPQNNQLNFLLYYFFFFYFICMNFLLVEIIMIKKKSSANQKLYKSWYQKSSRKSPSQRSFFLVLTNKHTKTTTCYC